MKLSKTVVAIASLFAVAALPTTSEARRSEYVRPSFTFETGDAITTLQVSEFGWVMPKKQPGQICVQQLRGIEITDASKYLQHTDQYGAVLSTASGSWDEVRKSCDVVGVVKDVTTNEVSLIHHWVNVKTNTRPNSNVYFTPLASGDDSQFMGILSLMTLGISDIFQSTAQSVVDGIQWGINARIAQKNADTAAVFNGLANELMLMMCNVQAARLAEEACPGAKINASQYVQQFQSQYRSFVYGAKMTTARSTGGRQ